MNAYFCPMGKICPAYNMFVRANNRLIQLANERGDQPPEEDNGVPSVFSLEGVLCCTALSGLRQVVGELKEYGVTEPSIDSECLLLGLIRQGDKK